MFIARGNAESIEVFMPEAEKIDILYATDSIKDLKYRKVIVGVISEEGVLYVPEDAKQLARDYLYSLSIVNGDTHVILDWNTVDGISMMKGDMVLYVHKATPEDLTNAQRRTVGDHLAISVVMLVGGEYVSQLGGHADIYERTENTLVYYVDTDGRSSLIESDHEDGITHTRVSHFSIYMYTDGEISDEFPIILVAIITIATVLVLLIILKIHRKS